MEVWKVKFLNVGSSYFPQSRVECHYSINSEHSWSSNDWIGLFKVGWSSVRDYHTFVWSLAPSNYKEGTSVNFCVHFQESAAGVSEGADGAAPGSGSFRDRAGAREGGHCRGPEGVGGEAGPAGVGGLLFEGGASPHERASGGDEEERRGDGDFDGGAARGEAGPAGKEGCRRAEGWAAGGGPPRAGAERRGARGRPGEVSASRPAPGPALAPQPVILIIVAIVVCRMKERAKRVATQKKEEENECKNLKLKLERTEIELRSLAAEFQSLRSSLAQRDTHALQLRDTITTLTHKLNNAHRKEAASEAALADLRGVQERLTASERCVDTLRAELRDAAAQRDSTQAELHRARLQAAQLTLQLADASLALREGRATWAQERESLQHNAEVDRARLDRLSDEILQKEELLQEERMDREKAEVELGREKDCNRVQLSETRRELQELKASLRVAQKEKEQLQSEKQEVMEYIRQLEQRLDALTDCKWSETLLQQSSRPDSPPSDSEDESPEALREGGSTRALSHYGLCEQPGPDALLPATPPPSPRRGHTVVISQPAPFCAPRQASAEAHSSESEEEYEVPQSEGNSSGEETALLLPDHRDTTYSDLVESPLW
uniref:Calcium binding and coiled-coil domain 1b n=1 Tax=Electrophorus electricus TaxID=8005 RepID=A0AAY5F1K3_ELEEL